MNVAVLGLGSIGQRHARDLLALGQPVHGYDPSPERRRSLEEIGGKSTDDRVAAIRDAEACVIASPSAFHLEDLHAAVNGGCHVFVEKPIAHTNEGLEPLFAKARHAGLSVFPGLVLRFHPAIRAAHEYIEAGNLGQPLWAKLQMSDYLPDWRPQQDHRMGYAADPRTGGVIFDLTHEFDVAHWLLGPATVAAAVAGNSGVLGIEAEDSADIILQHVSGVLSSMHFDYVTRPRRRITEIAGTAGILWIDVDSRRLLITGTDGEVLQDDMFDGSYQDDFRAQMSAFLASTRGKDVPRCSPAEALSVLKQVLTARRLAALPS
jgi:predicted dehydrogenase